MLRKKISSKFENIFHHFIFSFGLFLRLNLYFCYHKNVFRAPANSGDLTVGVLEVVRYLIISRISRISWISRIRASSHYLQSLNTETKILMGRGGEVKILKILNPIPILPKSERVTLPERGEPFVKKLNK